ncbi:WD repeat-containing protein 12 [Nowakowskiella sp. JEL0078]|nr:WD repeat-containing protein 12 [Nowakowskiella sp. JEL0078]
MNSEKVGLSADFSKLNSLLVTGHADPVVRVWDGRSSDSLTHKLKLDSPGIGRSTWTSGVCWSPSNSFTLAASNYDGALRVWDVRSVTTPLVVVKNMDESEDIVKVFGVDWFAGLLVSAGEEGVRIREYNN